MLKDKVRARWDCEVVERQDRREARNGSQKSEKGRIRLVILIT